MFSNECGGDVAPISEDVSIVSPAIPTPVTRYEICVCCRKLCRPNRSPQLLPCLHSVCKTCVTPARIGDTKRECPICKSSYNILEVTDNPFLKDSTSGPGTRTVLKCAGCEGTAVSGWCVECGEALCSICVSAHQRVRVTRDHTVLPQKLPTGFMPAMFCAIHRNEPMKLFCVSCNQLTCRDCQLTFHRSHGYQFLDEAVTAQREEIESLMARVRQQRATVKQSLEDLDGRLLDLEEIKSKMKNTMQKVLNHIRYALMKRASALFKDIQDLCGREKERITERKNILRRLEERQEYILFFTEKALLMDNHSALLSCKRQVQSQLQDLLSQNTVPAASMMDLKFYYEKEACFQIASFGKVVTKEVPFFRRSHNNVPMKTSPCPLQTQTLHPTATSHHSSPTLTLPASSDMSCTFVEITPTSSYPFGSLPHSTVPSPSPSTLTSCAPLTSVSHQSSALCSLPPIYSYSSSVSSPYPCPDSGLRLSAPSPLTSVSHPTKSLTVPSKHSRNKQGWSFHPYEPKNYKPATQQTSPHPPKPPPDSTVVRPPSSNSLSAMSESQSPPITVFPSSSPDLIMVISPLGANSLEQNNTNTVQTATDRGSLDSLPSAIPLEPQTKSLLVDLLGRFPPDKDDQLSKSLQCVLPVIAPADSQCEVPPAGHEKMVDLDLPVTENEPTSTVMETDSAPPVQLPQIMVSNVPCAEMVPVSCHGVNMDSASTNGISVQISTDIVAANGHMTTVHADPAPASRTAGHTPALPPHGRLAPVNVGVVQEPQLAAGITQTFNCLIQNEVGKTVQSCTQPGPTPTLKVLEDLKHIAAQLSLPLSTKETSDPAEEHNLQPMKMQHVESKASSSSSTVTQSTPSQQNLLNRAQLNQIPARQLVKCSTRLPTSLKEILEIPTQNLALALPVTPGKTSLRDPQKKNLLLKLLLGHHPRASGTELKDHLDSHGSLVEVGSLKAGNCHHPHTHCQTSVVAANGQMTTVHADSAPASRTVGHTPALLLHGSLAPVNVSGPRTSACSCQHSGLQLLSITKQWGNTVQSSTQPGPTPTLKVLEDLKHIAAQLSLPLSTKETSEPAKEHNFQPIKTQHEESEASSSSSTGPKSTPSQQDLLNRGQLNQTPKANRFVRLLLGHHPRTTKIDLTDQMDCRGSPVETEKTDDDDEDTKPKKSGGGLVGRHWLPRVSVLRMPISVPPSGHPLPQFHLLPGANEDEILLQMIEDDDQPEDSSLGRALEDVPLRCAACQIPESLTLCVQCGRGFHKDCHIPPIKSASSRGWSCILCRDLSDVRDMFWDERPRRPSLSLLDQRKCEHLLLALMCKKYSTILYHRVELSAHYIDVTLIRGRLLQKLSPPYRTPSEFVSDVWVLLENLLKNSKETDLVVKMQKCFQKKLSKVFGNALHPSLLRCPGTEESESVQETEDKVRKVRDTEKNAGVHC